MKKKITIGVVSVLVILVVLLLIIPIDVFENLGKKDNIDSPEVVVQPDNSGDLESINDKIAKDNEERGDSGEEISTEEPTEPILVESALQVTSPYMYEEIKRSDVSDDIYNRASSLSVEDDLFSFNSDVKFLGKTTGKNATLEKIKDILVVENYGYQVVFTDLVYICNISDDTFVCKLSPMSDDLIIIRCFSANKDITSSSRSIGEYCCLGFYVDNMNCVVLDEKEVILATYGVLD